jgi:hypothetical protein
MIVLNSTYRLPRQGKLQLILRALHLVLSNTQPSRGIAMASTSKPKAFRVKCEAARLCSKIKIERRSAMIIALNHCRTTLSDMCGLFECVTKLQHAPVIMMTANNLHTYRKAARRERAGN